MKRMVGVGIIVALVLLVLAIGIVSAGIEIINASVTPKEGFSDTNFNYTATVHNTYNKAQDFTLNLSIYNNGEEKHIESWTVYGLGAGKKTSRSFDFEFGSVSIVRTTNASYRWVSKHPLGWNENEKIGTGPTVKIVKLENTKVDPMEGPFNTYFNYSITVTNNLNISTKVKVDLYVSSDNITKKVTPTKECEVNPTSNRTLNWPVRLDEYFPEIPTNASYEFILYDLYEHEIDRESGLGPTKITPREPEIIVGIPPEEEIYYEDNLELEFVVEDEMGYLGTATLKAYKPPHYNKTQFQREGDRTHLFGDVYKHTWIIEPGPEGHNFTADDINITKTKPFKLCIDYDSYYDYTNWSCGNLTVTEYKPEIVDGPYLGPYSKEEKRKKLSEESWNNIYVEKKDLDGNFKFNVTIEDKIEKGDAILEVWKVNDSILSKNYNLTGPSVGINHQYSNESICFNKGNFSLRLYYNRSKLPPGWPCPSKPWKVYNITITPFEINFKNATVSPLNGPWNDTFNYSVIVSATRDLNITLNVFDPCTEEWPWKPVSSNATRKYSTKDGEKTLYWNTEPSNPPFSENCIGKSKFYFVYEGGESQVYTLGPELLKPPTFDNDSVDPNVTIYCAWSKSSTPCNYSVNVSTEDEYKVRLLVKDPVSNDWIPKGKPKEISSKTKNITWLKIVPIESIDKNKIENYIGNNSNFTFEYDGHTYHKEFPGPEIVAAFKDPRINLEPGDEEINYNDTFYYNVNVIACRNLNVTLKYYNGTEWINADKTNSTRYYTPNGWKTLSWQCIANDTWEKVMMEVEVEGETIKVY